MEVKQYTFTVSQSLERSWWQTYTEALCNSRGYETNYQKMVRQTMVYKKLKRDIEEALFAGASLATWPTPTTEG